VRNVCVCGVCVLLLNDVCVCVCVYTEQPIRYVPRMEDTIPRVYTGVLFVEFDMDILFGESVFPAWNGDVCVEGCGAELELSSLCWWLVKSLITIKFQSLFKRSGCVRDSMMI